MDDNHIRSVFVYGTLRPGGGNYHHLVGWVPHKQEPAILYGHVLMGRVPAPPFPYCVAAVDLRDHERAVRNPAPVQGALLTFDAVVWDGILRSMDRLEGVPHHYTRKLATVYTETSTAECWTYVLSHEQYARHEGLVPINHDWAAVALEMERNYYRRETVA